MALVPKKNVSKFLRDIKYKPKNKEEKTPRTVYFKVFKKKPLKTRGKIKCALGIGLAAIAIASGILAINAKNTLNRSFNYAISQVQIIKEALLEMKTDRLKNSLEALNDEIQNMKLKSENYGIAELLSIIGQFSKSLKEVPGAFKNISAISEKTSQVANDIDYLKNNALQLVFNQKGKELINKLDNLEKNLSFLEEISFEFKDQARKIKNLNSKLAAIYDVFDKNYLSINMNIYRSKEAVGALSSLLKSPSSRIAGSEQAPSDTKILLIFQNPAEMRPAGGFIGSFGYIALNEDGVKEIKIDDIYNADRQLNIAVAPPRELKGITEKWGARDANWFFNFPDSAKKVSYFLENSKLFSESNSEFKHVISINTNFLRSLIEITGPIEIPGYASTVDSNNFLKEIQYEVEAGRDKKPGQNPKRILSVLAPILIDKLKNLDDGGKIKLLESLKEAARQKDIMAFSEDETLQKIFLEFNLAGEIFTIPKNFSGDYLAVVNSNIAGGKSDAFISQQIRLKSRILEDGAIIDELSISRSHKGQNEKDWWYRAVNKNYAKILMPKLSEIISISGNNSSPYAYLDRIKSADNLKIDADLEGLEKNSAFIDGFNIWNGEENDKEFVGAWINTSAGKTKNLKLNYKQNKKIGVKNGAEFVFVFDKQSGDQGSLEYEITAPPEYIWKESGKSVFSYGTQQIKSREIIRLTLKKNLILSAN